MERDDCAVEFSGVLMDTGVVGIVISCLCFAPLSGVVFLGIWATGAVIQVGTTRGDCCVPASVSLLDDDDSLHEF